MEITFLGTGTIYPDPERRPSGLLLKHKGINLVFDSGPGTWFRLTEAKVDFRDIDAVFYTHMHLDHILDYPAYLFLTKNPDFRRSKPLQVFAPEGFEKFDRTLKELFGAWMEPDNAPVINILPREKKIFEFIGLTVTSAPVKHSDTSLAYRVEADGKVFVLGGDLDYCPEIVDLSKGCDLLVTECAFPENSPHPGHLYPSLAGKIAKESFAARLALTHFYPECKNQDMLTPAKEVFNGEIIIAKDLLSLKI